MRTNKTMIFYRYSRDEVIERLLARFGSSGTHSTDGSVFLEDFTDNLHLQSSEISSRLDNVWSADTRHVLQAIFVGSLRDSSLLSVNSVWQYLEFLRVCFEVSGKIYDRYSEPESRSRSGSWGDMENYLLLGINLMFLYQRNHCLDLLNTILKVNDLLQLLSEQYLEDKLVSLLLYSLKEERKEMLALYESREFRLTAG